MCEQLQDVARTLIWREDRVEDVIDFAVDDDECAPLEELHATCLKCWEVERLGEAEVFVRQDWEWQVEAFGGFALVVGGLSRESVKMVDSEGF